MRLTTRLLTALALGLAPLAAPSVAAPAAVTDAACTPAQMRVTLGPANGAAGTIYYPIVFTNVGGTCAIWGVPTVQPVAARRHRVGPPALSMSRGMMPARHVLTHGRAVSDPFGAAETGNYPASLCGARRASGVVVTLAPFVRSTYVRLPISVCTRQASTRTALIVPGRTGA